MLRTIELKIDELDYDAIQLAFATIQRGVLPTPSHDDANIAGRCVAEICRSWMEMSGLWKMPGEDDDQQEPTDAE